MVHSSVRRDEYIVFRKILRPPLSMDLVLAPGRWTIISVNDIINYDHVLIILTIIKDFFR